MKMINQAVEHDREVATFFENLRSIVVEYTYVDNNGILTKKVKTIKDRECTRFIGKEFCVCEFSDLHKLALAFNSEIFEAPEGIDKDRMNLWILIDETDLKSGGKLGVKLSQPPYVSVYKKHLIPNPGLGRNPYNKPAKEWECNENINLLMPEFMRKPGSIWLYDPFRGSLMPIKMEATRDYYKVKVVNLSSLSLVKGTLLEIMDDKTLLMVVTDIRAVEALLPISAYGEFKAVTDVCFKPVSSNAPYEAEMNNIVEV